MSQFTVTIVIPVWNQWSFTKACLDTLKPTLGVRDTVVIVDNGSRDETAKALKQYPWATVLTNEENLGFAKACNQGAAVAKGDIVVFLNNDTLLPSRWLDGLLSPFKDSTVYGTGPMSNEVSGPQQIAIDYSPSSISDMRRFARQWREENRNIVTETNRLVGFCLAVRRNKFEEIGGFDEGFGIGGFEDDDLCLRLIEAGGRLLICHESFVHHHGHATFDGNGLKWFEIQSSNLNRFRDKYSSKFGAGAFTSQPAEAEEPLLSACMIVKDEADTLARCIESLYELVDEVVVYDTGSTDNTRNIATVLGARVIEGYWDDDFGRARNAALAECKGDWILQIDADEVIEGDKAAFRNALMTLSVDGFQVNIVNLSADGKANLNHRPVRAFQRSKYHWTGRLHEQVVYRDGTPRMALPLAPGIEIKHYGYLPEMVESRNKAERNIRIAQLEAEEVVDGQDQAEKLGNLGRSYTIAGRHEEALNILTQARSIGSASEVTMRTILRAGAQAAMAIGQAEQSLTWIDDFEKASTRSASARFLRTLALTDLHRWKEAVEVSNDLTDLTDDDGVEFPRNLLRSRRAVALAGLQRWPEVAEEITPVAEDASHDEPIWPLVVESYWRTGKDLRTLLKQVPAKHFNSILAQLNTVPTEAADAVLEGFYDDAERRTKVLALAIRIAPALDTERTLEWSARLREIGMSEHCPLVVQAFNTQLPSTQRLKATALAFTVFGDERATGALNLIASTCEPEDYGTVLTDLDALAPALLEAFILAACTNAQNSLAMAQVLHGFGAGDEAVAVLMHGLGNEGGQVIGAQAAAWLDEVGRSTEAAGVRAALR